MQNATLEDDQNQVCFASLPVLPTTVTSGEDHVAHARSSHITIISAITVTNQGFKMFTNQEQSPL